MKALFIAIAMTLSSLTAFADTDTAVLIVRAPTEAQLDRKVHEAIPLVESGRYKYLHDNCSGNRRVYAVEFNGKRYRRDRHGNFTSYYSAAIKYSCQS